MSDLGGAGDQMEQEEEEAPSTAHTGAEVAVDESLFVDEEFEIPEDDE